MPCVLALAVVRAVRGEQEGVNPFTDRTPEEFAVRLGYAKANGYQRRGDGVVDPAVYLGKDALRLLAAPLFTPPSPPPPLSFWFPSFLFFLNDGCLFG